MKVGFDALKAGSYRVLVVPGYYNDGNQRCQWGFCHGLFDINGGSTDECHEKTVVGKQMKRDA